ncbi:ankyrin repeat domain-containing protein [Streptomyces sp. NPDC007264]|uniref:ankyrin repeat domain-containing protein n=1 Tax=Streptomyces sp. NPDC007264 TaxID=3364777 RepID=UPI0036D85AC0
MSRFSPDEAAAWQRIRRYAVPRWMIERAGARRLAGDWAGACAAAAVDVTFELPRIAGQYGTDVAAAVTDDLRHFAPDLLRWHLPRLLGGRTTLAPDVTVLLSAHGPQGHGAAPYLYVLTPVMTEGPQRLSLRFGDPAAEGGTPTEDWTAARHLWDARRTAELLEHCGGNAVRPPFLNTDGTPRPQSELPRADPGDDPAERAEWAALLHERGEVEAAFAAAGIEVDLTPPPSRWREIDPRTVLASRALALTRLEPGVRRLAEAGGGNRFRIPDGWRTSVLLELTDPTGPGGLRAGAVGEDDSPLMPQALWHELPDLELLRSRRLSPAHLHPLVGAALFPSLPVPDGPPGPEAPVPVRVRCRGSWHHVVSRGGRLDVPHTEEEQQRERAMRAFGGAVAGCFAVQQAWTSGTERLPRALRDQRRELFLRAQHGDTPGVLELLDAGVDPRIRDGAMRSLLHVLPLVDHELLLDRLLAAGLDLEGRDYRECTPLCTAVGKRGSVALVEALLAAGARIDVTDNAGLSLDQIIRKYKRHDLEFLRERVAKEHPGIGADWWEEEWEDWQE